MRNPDINPEVVYTKPKYSNWDCPYQEKCPIRQVAEQLKHVQSLKDARDICGNHGLRPSIRHLQGLPMKIVMDSLSYIYVARCGLRTFQNRGSCGRLLTIDKKAVGPGFKA